MAFTFQTQSNYDEVASQRNRLQAGWYEAVVLSATEGRSQKGNPQITLRLGLEVGSHKLYERMVWLPLMSATAWKIEQFLAATGKQFRKGEQLTIDARMCEGKRLCVTACLDEFTGNDGNVHYALEIMDFRRRADCPHIGAMTDEELAQWGLNPDGTRKTVMQAARETLDESREGAQKHGAPMQMPHEEDDDIPF